jgi:hypothetical protein
VKELVMNLSEEAIARANSVRRAETLLTEWAHVIDPDVDWRAALSHSYWAYAAPKLNAGDAVTVHSSDHLVQFRVLVLDSNPSSGQAYLHLAFLPIYPADLELPTLPLQIPPRFAVRQAPASSLFRVIDMETGQPVVDDRDRRSAQEAAAELEKALAFTGAQVASALAIRYAAEQTVTDEAQDEQPASPGAMRTRKYRERQRATQEAGAA